MQLHRFAASRSIDTQCVPSLTLLRKSEVNCNFAWKTQSLYVNRFAREHTDLARVYFLGISNSSTCPR
jgi:hypothetical protein